MHDRNDGTISVFCHIPKTGGMTFHDMLRRYFGHGHLIGVPARGWHYGPRDLARDLRLNPGLTSLGGHAMRPFVDFGEPGDRLRWYTILRDPFERSISNYQHQHEKRGRDIGFDTWLQRDCNQNWHVAMLAGEQDLEAAKQILAERIACLGFIEKYDEFLLLLRQRMGWDGFNVTYRRKRNPPRADDVRREIKADLDRYRDLLFAANELDLALYDYAQKKLYPRQVAEYGEERLARDLEEKFAEPYETAAEVWRRRRALLFEKGFYRPLTRLLAGSRASR